MSTTLQEQLIRQSLWQPRSHVQAGYQHEALVHNEFSDIDKRQQEQLDRLCGVIDFCRQYVPYYRQHLNKEPLTDLTELQQLPVLSKLQLQQAAEKLKAERLPRGHQVTGVRQSSGTTGVPTRVLHTQVSDEVFATIKQREYRWFNFNPEHTLAAIRLPGQLPPTSNGELKTDETMRRPGWPNVSRYFHTGAFLGFSVLNPVEVQLQWLQEHNPHYLMAYAESLEHLAFAQSGTFAGNRLQALLSIAETLTKDMRTRINDAFARPVHQNYGLNELGVVASRCPEGGRYHVHSEYYHVEIVDQDGQHCIPGQSGRILVTSLSNPAMPLLRYDTDDLAVATDQQCPCGRTLPCFGEILGRYSRIAYLPEGTLGHVGVIRDLLAALPHDQSEFLRKFQIYQNRQGALELRIVGTRPFDTAFFDHFEAGWKTQALPDAPPFSLRQLDRLSPSAGGKFQDFISDFVP